MNIERNMKYRCKAFMPLDIYSYINSPDVAKHCREVGKVWTPFEMAVLISWSQRHSISEKHAAWCVLMDEYPDIPTPESRHFHSYDSFHEKLVEWMDHEEQTLALLKKAELGAIYTYKAWWHGKHKQDETYYTTYDKVWDAAREYWERDEIREIVISKIFADDVGRIDAHADYDGNIYSVDAFCDGQTQLQWYPYLQADKALENYHDSSGLFNLPYLDVPVPFKRGDILISTENPLRDEEKRIIVLDRLDRDDAIVFARHLKDGDDSDMIAWGFSVDEDGSLYHDHFIHYDNLAYFDGKLEGENALLHYVSLFINDKIQLPELLTMQCRIILQHQIENDLRIDTHGCFVWKNLLAENRLTKEEKEQLEQGKALMPLVADKLSIHQVEFLAKEIGGTMESIQMMLCNKDGYLMGRCAGIVHDENHYEKTNDSKFNYARRAMVRSILASYGCSEFGWRDKYAEFDEDD